MALAINAVAMTSTIGHLALVVPKLALLALPASDAGTLAARVAAMRRTKHRTHFYSWTARREIIKREK